MTRLTAAYATGRILNPLLARSQFVGGLVWGIGMALHEATVMDERSGRIVNDSLADYLIPVHADMPRFDVHIVEEDDPHLAGGIKGIGMIGTVGTSAAIANAVFHATGRRIRDLPIRLEHCLFSEPFPFRIEIGMGLYLLVEHDLYRKTGPHFCGSCQRRPLGSG